MNISPDGNMDKTNLLIIILNNYIYTKVILKYNMNYEELSNWPIPLHFPY